MNAKKEWMLNTMTLSITFGLIVFCFTADSFNKGFDEGYKVGQDEVIDRFANAYNKAHPDICQQKTS